MKKVFVFNFNTRCGMKKSTNFEDKLPMVQGETLGGDYFSIKR
ncbi:hypothetical protein [Alkalihalobacillus sp. 1P02AB]